LRLIQTISPTLFYNWGLQRNAASVKTYSSLGNE